MDSIAQAYAANQDAAYKGQVGGVLFDGTQRQASGNASLDWNKVNADYHTGKLSDSDVMEFAANEQSLLKQKQAAALTQAKPVAAPKPQVSTPTDMAKSAVAGVGNAVGNSLNALADIREWVDKNIHSPFGTLNPQQATMLDAAGGKGTQNLRDAGDWTKAEMYKPQTEWGKGTEQVSRFLSEAVGFGKLKVLQGGWKAMTGAAAASSWFAADPNKVDDYIANLVSEHLDPGIAKTLVDYVAQNPNDPAVTNRTRMALQEALTVPAAEGLIKFGKYVWSLKGGDVKAVEQLTKKVDEKVASKATAVDPTVSGDVSPIQARINEATGVPSATTDVVKAAQAKTDRLNNTAKAFRSDQPVTPRSSIPGYQELSEAAAQKAATESELVTKMLQKTHTFDDHMAATEATQRLEELVKGTVTSSNQAGVDWVQAARTAADHEESLNRALETPPALRTADDLLTLAEHNRTTPEILTERLGAPALTDGERAAALQAAKPKSLQDPAKYTADRLAAVTKDDTKVNTLVQKVENAGAGKAALTDGQRSTLLAKAAEVIEAVQSVATKHHSQFPSLLMNGTLKPDGTIDLARLAMQRGETNEKVLETLRKVSLGSTKQEIQANLAGNLFGAGAAMADDNQTKDMSTGEMVLTAILFGLAGRGAVKAWFKGTSAAKTFAAHEADAVAEHAALVGEHTSALSKLHPNISPITVAAKSLPRISAGKAEEVSKLLAAGDHKGAAAALAEADANHFNLSNIDSDADIHNVIAQFTESFNAEGVRAAGGAETHAETQALAAELGTSMEDLHALYGKDTANLAARVTANRALLAASAEQVSQLADRALNAAFDDRAAALVALRKQVLVHANIQNAMKGVQTEIARALSAFRIKAYSNDLVLNKVEDVLAGLGGSHVNETFAKEIRDVFQQGAVDSNRYIRNAAGATTMDMVKSAWYASVLSGLPTHTANVLSNFAKLVEGSFENSMALALGKLRGSKGAEYYAASDYMKGQLLGARVALGLASKEFPEFSGSTMAQAFKNNMPVLDAASSMKLDGMVANPAISAISSSAQGVAADSLYGKVLDTAGKYVFSVPGRALVAEDEFFKSANYFGKLHMDAAAKGRMQGLSGKELDEFVANQLVSPDHDLLESAIRAAREGTFTQGLGESATRINRAFSSLPGGFLVMPFMRTSVNISKSFFERVPVLGLLADNNQAMLKAGGMQANLVAAKQAVGALYITGALGLASSGVLTGGNIFETRKDAESLSNVGTYSIHVGGQSYAINRLSPIGWFLSMTADWYNYSSHMNEYERMNMAQAALTIFAKFAESQSFLTGVANLTNWMYNTSRGQDGATSKYLGQMAGSFIPNLLATENRVHGDDEVKEYWTLFDQIKARVPGVSKDVFPSRNLFGKAQHYEGGLGVDDLSPIYEKTDNPSPAAKEIYRLNVDIAKPPKRMGNVDMSAKEYDDYMKLFDTMKLNGKNLEEALNDRISKPDWQGLSEHQANYQGQKEQWIRAIYSGYHALVNAEFQKTHPRFAGQVMADTMNKGRASLGLPVNPLEQAAPYSEE